MTKRLVGAVGTSSAACPSRGARVFASTATAASMRHPVTSRPPRSPSRRRKKVLAKWWGVLFTWPKGPPFSPCHFHLRHFSGRHSETNGTDVRSARRPPSNPVPTLAHHWLPSASRASAPADARGEEMMATANVMVRGVSSAPTRRCCSPVDRNASGAHGDAVPALPALRDDLPVLPIQVGRPVVHQAAPTLEEITACVGRLGGVLYRVGERGLDHFAGCVRPFRGPVPGSSTGTHAARRRCRVL